MKALNILLITLTLITGCKDSPKTEKEPYLRRSGSFKVVSMAPNVTEILYALGQGSNVVGVSRFSHYPPEASEKPSVGGTYDPNWEMLVSLQPDLVIGLDSQQEIASQLAALDIAFLGVPHERVDDIMQSILLIGNACGAEKKAQNLFQCLEKKVEQASSVSTHAKPRVLVCIGHDEQLTRMYIAARNTFYDDLITLAGGINACEQAHIKYPEISPEGLHTIAPDLIIDLLPQKTGRNAVDSNLWKPYRVIMLTNDYAFIPGPRFGLLLDDISTAIKQNN